VTIDGRRQALWTATLVLCLHASSAMAQSTPDPETEALAEAQRGLQARRDGRDDEARQAFERSLALAPRASVRAQLGFALQAIGRWVEAEASLAAAAAIDDPWIERHRATIDAALAEIRAHLGTLTLSALPVDTTLRIDGVPTAPDVAIRLPVGTVTVSAQRDGYYGTERVVVVRAGDMLRESFDLRAREPVTLPPVEHDSVGVADDAQPDAGPEPTLLLAAPREAETRHWGGPAITMAVGAASLGAGFAFLAARDGAVADLLSHGCVESPTEYVCGSAEASAAQGSHASADAFAAASATTLATGGTLLVLGGGWLLVEWLRPASDHDEMGVEVTPQGVRWTF